MTEAQRESGPTVQRMLVGARLRTFRVEQGISREQAGHAIRASEWKIHRLENGQVRFKDRDVVDLLSLYGVTEPHEVAAIVALAREANAPGWWQPYSDVLPQWFRAYIDLEQAATIIRSYEGHLVPGLLQTEGYMRALLSSGLPDQAADGDEVEQRVALRRSRQRLLARENGPRLWAVVDEAALRRPIGGHAVMRAQLEHLVEVAELPSVTVQILPFRAGAHRALGSSFSVLRFEDQALPDVVYVEHLTNALYLDRLEDVERYIQVMESICVQGEPPEKTVGALDAILRDGWL